MNEQNKKVPTVRFKGFTNDWEQRKGKSIFYSKSNKDFPELTVLSATQDKGMIPRSSTGIDIKYEKKSLRGYKKIEPGDFVVHLRSFQGGFAYSDLTGIVSPAYTVFTFKQPEMFNNYFWKEKFTSYNFIQLLKKVTYGVRDGRSISYSDFLTLNEKFPVKVEQTKIADLFKIIDNLITLQQRKLALLKQLKKGFLQKMFADKDSKQPILRFKGFHDDWEQRKLSKVKDVRDGTHDSPKYHEKGFPLITSKNLTPSGVDFSDASLIDEHDYQEINKRSLVEIHDILFGMIGTIGNPVIVKKSGFAIKNVALIKHGGNLSNYFLLNLLNSPIFAKYINKENAGGTQKFLSLSIIRNFRFLAPGSDEQNKIGNMFEQVDTFITLQQQKLAKYQSIKKSLLQQMFI